MRPLKQFLILIAAATAMFAQQHDTSGAIEAVTVQVRQAGAAGPVMQFSGQATDNTGSVDASPSVSPLSARHRNPILRLLGFKVKSYPVVPVQVPGDVLYHGPLGHPYDVVARHSNGEIFYRYHGFNLRTSAGTNWQSQIMLDTSTPAVNAQCNYLGLTNTAITPAEADTTLSGEIVANGLSRAQGTYTNNSTTLTVPSAPTVTPQGSAGSTTYYYWVLAGNQGIYTTLSASGTTATANATLSSANNVQVSWTPIAGAASYYVFRTTSNSAPTGATTAIAGITGTSQPACNSATCYINDIANTAAGVSVTIPASNLTNYGTMTLVHTWTATASQSAQAFGVFTAASSGTMCFEGIFTPVSLNTNDTLQLVETIQF